MTTSRNQSLIAPLFFFTGWVSAFGWMILQVG
jgi:hypothetical protein